MSADLPWLLYSLDNLHDDGSNASEALALHQRGPTAIQSRVAGGDPSGPGPAFDS